jgi:hypothetical protein
MDIEKMDIEKIENLKRRRFPGQYINNLAQELLDIILELSLQVNSIQRELDDYDNYRMEQNERRS